MVLGYTLLALALTATVAGNVLFTLSRRRGRERLAGWGRIAAVTACGAVVGASVYLSHLIWTHQFQVAYVAEYSAKRAASKYLFAAFWGGQEGSILLWTFWTSLLGAVLAYRGGERTSKVWPIFGVAQVYLLGLLLLKCPFALGAGPVPADGRGLNPLLENYWMVIHPPVLFLGFSALLIPYAWAVYGLVYRDWDGWARAAFSWALFAFTTLGFGVALGGYWAYETLGWGGFWGWDPVENSSLVPWLFLTALLHGIAIQRANGGFKITNFVLGFLPFSFMFYGTFLTRTGLLTDFSVHSFSSLGEDGFWLMLGGVLTSVIVPLGFLAARFKGIPKPAAYERPVTREFGYFLAAAILGLVGLIVAVGMSAPLITKIWTDKGASAKPEFYNEASYPLALILTIGMAATPYFAWRSTDTNAALKRLFPSYIAAILLTLAMTVGTYLMGVRKPWMILLFATSVFAVFANIVSLAPRLKRRESRRTVGGFIAHAGAGIALAGVAALVAFSQSAERVMLIKDQPVKRLGHTFTYLGMTSHPFDRENNAIRIRVEKNGKSWEVNPRYYFAPWDNKDTLFANPPAIQRLFWGDLYIAHSGGPMGLDGETEPNPNNGFSLAPKETRQLGDYRFAFLGLDFDEAANAARASGDPAKMNALNEVFFKAMVAVDYRGKTALVSPSFRLDQRMGGVYSLPVAIPGPEGAKVMLRFVPPTDEDMKSPDPMHTVKLQTLNAPDPTETILVDVSTKPLIWLVWTGTLLYTLGGFVAYRRRALERGLMGAGEESPGQEKTPSEPPPASERKGKRAKQPLSPEPARASATKAADSPIT